jgi:hypothetical protein
MRREKERMKKVNGRTIYLVISNPDNFCGSMVCTALYQNFKKTKEYAKDQNSSRWFQVDFTN